MRRDREPAVSISDYSPVDVVNPLDGEVFTVYNLNLNKRGLVDRDRRQVDRCGQAAATLQRGRIRVQPAGSARDSFFGGWTLDRCAQRLLRRVDNPTPRCGTT